MEDNHVAELLNRVGKSTFVNHYYDFKDLYLDKISANQVKDKLSSSFTDKSKSSRSSKAKRIFREGLELQALEEIIYSNNSRVDDFRELAKEIFKSEKVN